MARTLKQVVQDWVAEALGASLTSAVTAEVGKFATTAAEQTVEIKASITALTERVTTVENQEVASVDPAGFVTAAVFDVQMRAWGVTVNDLAANTLSEQDRGILDWMRPTYLLANDQNAAPADDPIVLAPV